MLFPGEKKNAISLRGGEEGRSKAGIVVGKCQKKYRCNAILSVDWGGMYVVESPLPAHSCVSLLLFVPWIAAKLV